MGQNRKNRQLASEKSHSTEGGSHGQEETEARQEAQETGVLSLHGCQVHDRTCSSYDASRICLALRDAFRLCNVKGSLTVTLSSEAIR